jgi:hypothetical protein
MDSNARLVYHSPRCLTHVAEELARGINQINIITDKADLHNRRRADEK